MVALVEVPGKYSVTPFSSRISTVVSMSTECCGLENQDWSLV